MRSRRVQPPECDVSSTRLQRRQIVLRGRRSSSFDNKDRKTRIKANGPESIPASRHLPTIGPPPLSRRRLDALPSLSYPSILQNLHLLFLRELSPQMLQEVRPIRGTMKAYRTICLSARVLALPERIFLQDVRAFRV